MRIFSGIQPTGALHIGNYLGMLKQSVELQEEGECIYCVVDLHAMTIPYDPKQMQKNILEGWKYNCGNNYYTWINNSYNID